MILVTLQLGGPISAAFYDTPPAPVSHADHVAPQETGGCEPFHDETLCLSCRVLSLHPPHPNAAATAPPAMVTAAANAIDLGGAVRGMLVATPLHARAPPRI